MATNKKTNSILTFAAAAVFALVFYVGITNAESGSYYYAAISGIHGEKISVKYRSLDGDLYYICDTANLSCLKSDENNFTVAKTPPQLTDKNHFFNRDRSKVFVSDSSGFGASEVIRNAVYAVSPENLITLERILPSEDLKLFDFSPDGFFLVYLDDREGFATLYKIPPVGSSPLGINGTRV